MNRFVNLVTNSFAAFSVKVAIKILFGSIYNLFQLGAKEISISAIEDYLETKPKSLATYKANKGAEYLQKISENVQISNFQYLNFAYQIK